MLSEALVQQDLEGPGNVKEARDHSFLHVSVYYYYYYHYYYYYYYHYY